MTICFLRDSGKQTLWYGGAPVGPSFATQRRSVTLSTGGRFWGAPAGKTFGVVLVAVVVPTI